MLTNQLNGTSSACKPIFDDFIKKIPLCQLCRGIFDNGDKLLVCKSCLELPIMIDYPLPVQENFMLGEPDIVEENLSLAEIIFDVVKRGLQSSDKKLKESCEEVVRNAGFTRRQMTEGQGGYKLGIGKGRAERLMTEQKVSFRQRFLNCFRFGSKKILKYCL